MYAAISRSETGAGAQPLLPAYIRAQGRIACRLGLAPDGTTRLLELREGGGYRLKMPRGPGFEGVIVNTGGGLAGGDRLDVSVSLDAGTAATLTTQSAEKVYRAQRDPAMAAVAIDLGPRSSLSWIPQPTLLFDGARLERRIEVAMAPDSGLLIAEAVILGRAAMGEIVQEGTLADRWSIRRDGRLVMAEALRLTSPIADLLDRRCTGAGARAFATLLLVAPDAEARLDAVRSALVVPGVEAGASAWNGLLVVRCIGTDAASIGRQVVTLLGHLGSGTQPRVWL
jgi:urease accessory protein